MLIYAKSDADCRNNPNADHLEVSGDLWNGSKNCLTSTVHPRKTRQNRGDIAATFGVRRVLIAMIRLENNDLGSPCEVY